MQSLEHPDITRTQKWGFPNMPKEPEMCESCGEEPLTDTYFILDGMKICSKCLIELACDELRANVKAASDILGAEEVYDG